MKRTFPPNLSRHNHTIVVPNFFGKGKHLETWQLGWQPENRREAKSSVSKKIFNTYVEIGHYNIIFYYVGDGNFYGIHAENCPIPIFRFKKGASRYPIYQIEDKDTHDYADGEIMYEIPSGKSVWETVTIDDKPLEEVLQNSYIVSIS
jgi:hypothetical protein